MIWDINFDGRSLCSNEDIKEAAVNFFGTLYKQRRVPVLEEHMGLIREYPVMFSEEDNRRLLGEVSTEEIKRVIKSFAVDKILGPDGWTPDFFLYFIEEFIVDLKDFADEARVTGKINGAIWVSSVDQISS